jgi:hypothetical protein
MTRRSPVAVLLLGFFTFYIYHLIWMVKTKDECNSQGAQIPTAWLIIVPIANIFWMWKLAEGIGVVTKGKAGGAVGFILLWFLGPIGDMILQGSLNEVAGGAMQKAA